MRIRSTKPEFWRSETMAEFDWDTRLVLKALESYVDDNGVGRDREVIFCADAFPHDLAKSPEIREKVSRSLRALSERNLVVRYRINGEPFIYVRHWKKWQYIDKPKAGRYPRPDGTMNYRDVVDESIGAGQGVTDAESDGDSPELPENFAKTARKVPEECPQIQSGEQGIREIKERETGARNLTLIPDDWQPGLGHRAKARSLGITDINAAAEAFRNHALSEARQSANWDAAFHTWLASPKTRAAERDRNTTTGRRQATSDLAFANTQALKDNTDRLELEQ